MASHAIRAVIRTRADFDRFAQGIEWTGQPYTVTLGPFRRPRTLDQNALMHVLFRGLADFCGYTEDDIKDYFKQTFGPRKTLKLGGKERIIAKSTAEYSVTECQDMIEHIYRVGAEAGCSFDDVS